MPTKAEIVEADEVESETNFYDTPKHKEVRKWLGIPDSPRALPEWKWVPNNDWQALQGLLSDQPEHDTTEMKARNRAEEEEHDARKFGPPT